MKVNYPQTIDILSRFIYTMNVIKNYSVLIVYMKEQGRGCCVMSPEDTKNTDNRGNYLVFIQKNYSLFIS